MNELDVTLHPHRRFNPLTGEWVLISPHRTGRPWQGRVEQVAVEKQPAYDPSCYLCPGNRRANGEQNPDYEKTFVFTNDFAALLPDTPEGTPHDERLIRSETERGTCRVVCFSPRHDLTLPEMNIKDITGVVNLWADQVAELGKEYKWVQIFENKGEIMGCSNPHPHCQIWAGSLLPNEPFKEKREQGNYFKAHGSVLLMDYLAREQELNERIIISNDHWVVLTPFWAVWPFETLLLPRRHVQSLPDLNGPEREALASLLKRLLTRYDNIFKISFPYTMGWHGIPTDGENYDYWQLHAHFLPPLLRSASVKKFMVGYEMLAEAQRDITQEQAAELLRSLSDVH